jgi:hypothetical protein
MERVEQRLQIAPPTVVPPDEASENERLKDEERKELLDLADQLTDPELSPEERIELVERIHQILNHDGPPEKKEPTEQENGRRPRDPP